MDLSDIKELFKFIEKNSFEISKVQKGSSFTEEDKKEIIESLEKKLETIAEDWLKAGFTTKEVIEWIDFYYETELSSKDAFDWFNEGFTPEEASDWKHDGSFYLPKEAKKWKDEGFTPAQAQDQKSNFPDPKKARESFVYAQIESEDSAYDFFKLYKTLNVSKKSSLWDIFGNKSVTVKFSNEINSNKSIVFWDLYKNFGVDIIYGNDFHRAIIDDGYFREFIQTRKKDDYSLSLTFKHNYLEIIKYDEEELPTIKNRLSYRDSEDNQITLKDTPLKTLGTFKIAKKRMFFLIENKSFFDHNFDDSPGDYLKIPSKRTSLPKRVALKNLKIILIP